METLRGEEDLELDLGLLEVFVGGDVGWCVEDDGIGEGAWIICIDIARVGAAGDGMKAVVVLVKLEGRGDRGGGVESCGGEGGESCGGGGAVQVGGRLRHATRGWL